MGESEERFELTEIQKLEGHKDKVWCVAWNPVAGTDGTPAILASCSADKTVRVWKQHPITSAFYCMATIEGVHSKTVRSCSWSPSGHLLAIASHDGTTSIWDKIGNDFEHLCTLEGHKREVISVSWDPSGTHLATCGRDRSVYIWAANTSADYECAADLVEHQKTVTMVQWHPFEDLLFSCGYDNTIKVWAKNIDYIVWNGSQTLDHVNNGHSSTVWSISVNATGDKMVTSSDDLSIKVWGAERMQSGYGYGPWKHLYTLSGYHDQTIFSVHWSSEGIIASGAADDAICLFVENQDGLESKASYKLLLKKEKAHETDVNSVQWSPKEIGLLASSSADGTVKIWKLTPRQ